MKKTINKKELLLKQRRKWDINPVTKVEESKKNYDRKKMKQNTRNEIDKELSES